MALSELLGSDNHYPIVEYFIFVHHERSIKAPLRSPRANRQLP
jgi:hypothetical protein